MMHRDALRAGWAGVTSNDHILEAKREVQWLRTALRCFTPRSRPAAAFFAAKLASCSAPFASAALRGPTVHGVATNPSRADHKR